MCFRNLSHRKLRTCLCIFGVAIAICFTVAVGATTSRYAAVMTEMSMFFREEIVVVSRNVIVIQGFPIGGVIPQSVVNDIDGIDGVEKVVPMLFNLEFKLGEVSNIIPINVTIGLPIEDLPTLLGSASLRSGDRLPLENSTDEVIVGCSIADQYGISSGSNIMLKGRELTVCGIIEGPLTLLQRSIIMNLELAQEILKYPMQINMAIVKPKPNVTREELAGSIEKQISYVMALTENERNDLTEPILEAIGNLNMAIQGVLLFLSMILVTILGMINVSERRRDFSTLDAIGAPSGYTFRIVLLETSLIGVLGGAIGIVFGSLTALILASFYTSIPLAQFFPSIFEIVPPFYMLEIFITAVVACCVGGIIPAIGATKTRITEILRTEY
jgi:putative ABC transport system permease protein